MREVAELLGHPSMPPRWALGFLQSTRHFEDTTDSGGWAARCARSESRVTR